MSHDFSFTVPTDADIAKAEAEVNELNRVVMQQEQQLCETRQKLAAAKKFAFQLSDERRDSFAAQMSVRVALLRSKISGMDAKDQVDRARIDALITECSALQQRKPSAAVTAELAAKKSELFSLDRIVRERPTIIANMMAEIERLRSQIPATMTELEAVALALNSRAVQMKVESGPDAPDLQLVHSIDRSEKNGRRKRDKSRQQERSREAEASKANRPRKQRQSA